MARADQTEIRLRLVIEHPVPGVLHSLQDDNRPLDPQRSAEGAPLVFSVPLRITRVPGAATKFFGRQVRREGPVRRFIYICVGTSAGDHASPWTRRMKIDVHDIADALLEQAVAGAVLQGTFSGTGRDGTPACATIRPIAWAIAP